MRFRENVENVSSIKCCNSPNAYEMEECRRMKAYPGGKGYYISNIIIIGLNLYQSFLDFSLLLEFLVRIPLILFQVPIRYQIQLHRILY